MPDKDNKEIPYLEMRPEDATIKLRLEFFSHCRHKERYLLRKCYNQPF